MDYVIKIKSRETVAYVFEYSLAFLWLKELMWFWFLVTVPLHILDRSPALQIGSGGGNLSNLAECWWATLYLEIN